MIAADATFGIEIECTLPAGTVAVGSYHRGLPVPGLPEGWTAQHDGSIRARRGHQGVELVSPVLSGAEGLRQIVTVCRWLKERRASVNRSTGLHVHVGWTEPANALARLVHLTANFERALYAVTGTKSRERGRYCMGIQQVEAFRQVTGARLGAGEHERYRVLNLTNLATRRQQTVEFRAFAGTTNAAKIIMHVRLCLALAERASTAARKTNWVAQPPKPTSPIARGGEGQTAVNRLMYQLGWTKGRTDHTYGDVHAPGLPTVQASKRLALKLAAKYDRQP